VTAGPPLSSLNDRPMRWAAAGTSSGADRFMMSNKTIQTDQDPCQWMKLSFRAKREVEPPPVWQVVTSKTEITFFLSHKKRGPVLKNFYFRNLTSSPFQVSIATRRS